MGRDWDVCDVMPMYTLNITTRAVFLRLKKELFCCGLNYLWSSYILFSSVQNYIEISGDCLGKVL